MSIKSHINVAGITNNAYTSGSIKPKDSAGPTCVNFFPCDEGTGTVLNDVVGGLTPTVNNNWGTGPDGGTYHDGSTTDAASGAAFTNIADQDFAFLAVADRGDTAVLAAATIGRTGASQHGLGLAAGVVLVPDLQGSINDGAPVASSDGTNVAGPDTTTQRCTVGIVKNGDAGYLWIDYGDGSTPSIYTDTSWNISAITTLNPDQFITNTAWLYGMALWVFPSGYKTDYAAAFAQMNTDWRAGKKVLYPGWIDE